MLGDVRRENCGTKCWWMLAFLTDLLCASAGRGCQAANISSRIVFGVKGHCDIEQGVVDRGRMHRPSAYSFRQWKMAWDSMCLLGCYVCLRSKCSS